MYKSILNWISVQHVSCQYPSYPYKVVKTLKRKMEYNTVYRETFQRLFSMLPIYSSIYFIPALKYCRTVEWAMDIYTGRETARALHFSISILCLFTESPPCHFTPNHSFLSNATCLPLKLSFLCSSSTVCLSLPYTHIALSTVCPCPPPKVCLFSCVCSEWGDVYAVIVQTHTAALCWSAQRGHDSIMENSACQNVLLVWIALSLQRRDLCQKSCVFGRDNSLSYYCKWCVGNLLCVWMEVCGVSNWTV